VSIALLVALPANLKVLAAINVVLTHEAVIWVFRRLKPPEIHVKTTDDIQMH
jgi:hypothetical protein